MKIELKNRHYCEVFDGLETENITINLDQFFGGSTTYTNIKPICTCQVCGEDTTTFFIREDGAVIPWYQYPNATVKQMLEWTSW